VDEQSLSNKGEVIIEREKERASGSVRHEKIVTKPGEIER
jgi:hypothetical protein